MARKAKEKNNETITKRRTFNDHDLVDVMNYTTGECIWINPTTHREWNWFNFGSIIQIPLSELVIIKGQRPDYFLKPYLVIMDEDVVDYFGFNELYKLIIKPNQVQDFFNLNEQEMVNFLNKTTKDVRDVIVRLTKEHMKNNTFNDSFKQRLIQNTINEINKKNNENYFDINLFEVFDEDFEL